MIMAKLFSVISLFLVAAADPLTIIIPSSSSSSNLSNPICPDFVGLSIELSYAMTLLGTNASVGANPFFVSYINNMKNRTSAAPSLRLGGNSADEGTFNMSATLTDIMSTISMATGARWTATLNFENATSTANAFGFASSALLSLGDNLEAFEMGNEPDLYPGDQRDRSYNISQYASEWTAFTMSLNTQLSSKGFLHVKPLYQAGAFSGRWNTGQLIALGFLNTSGSLVSSFSQHRYGLDGCTASARPSSIELVSHSTVQSHASLLGALAAGSLAAQKRFVVGETNSISCGGVRNISNTVTSTLWGVDWILQLASRNVSSMNFHTNRGGSYVPFSVNPWVAHPLYYAFIIAAEAISQQPRIAEIELADQFTIAYLVYPQNASSLPSKIILIDTNIEAPSMLSPRVITLSFSANLTAVPIAIKRLTSPSPAETIDIQWANQTFQNSQDGNLINPIRLERPNSTQGGNVVLQLYPASVVMIELGVQANADPYVLHASKAAPRMVEAWSRLLSVMVAAVAAAAADLTSL